MLSYEELNSIYPVRTLLLSLNVSKLQETEDYFKFSSPFREDRNPSMILYKKNLFCIDFASDYRASIFKFVKDLTGESLFSFADIDRNNISSTIFSSSLKKSQQSFPLRKKAIKIAGKLKSIQSNELAKLYCKKRNVSDDFIDEFNIKFAQNVYVNGTYFHNRVCIPIIERGKTVSMEGRDITQSQYAKVLYPKGGSVSTLFNIDNLDFSDTLIIVEGILDIPRIWKTITKNVTTTFGIMITSAQKELISKFKDVILFPDGDEAGRKMIRSFDEFYEEEFRIAYIDEKDPGDAEMIEIDRVLSHPQSSTQYFLEKSELFPKKQFTFF